MSGADEPVGAADLRRLVDGYQVSQVVHAAAVLGLADLLADGAWTSDDLAAATGTEPHALYRLLRALAALGVLQEDDGRRFTLTELGRPLRSDAPDSVAAWAIFVGRPAHRAAWTHLVESLQTGDTAFRIAHGESVWDYRARHPEEQAVFDRAMAANARGLVRSLLDGYDFRRFGTIVDVGGGNGTLLAALLERHPSLRGVLFDAPHVVAGVDLGPRCEVVGGSFFETVPEGGDAYVLKAVLHDWDDEEALAILRVVARAAPTLLVVERVLGPPNEEPAAKLADVNMLVATGGRERTVDEYAALFADAGFALGEVASTATGWAVIEGRRLRP